MKTGMGQVRVITLLLGEAAYTVTCFEAVGVPAAD